MQFTKRSPVLKLMSYANRLNFFWSVVLCRLHFDIIYCYKIVLALFSNIYMNSSMLARLKDMHINVIKYTVAIIVATDFFAEKVVKLCEIPYQEQ